MVAIIDYGMGNIHSVRKALELFGAKTILVNKASGLQKAKKIVLPGVGAFDDAMQALKKQNLADAIKEHIAQHKIFLGICLGMQLLFETSKEAPKTKGLALLEGKVAQFSYRQGQKVPHMGWNQIRIGSRECPLLVGVPDAACVYFCHSYYPLPKAKRVIAATCDYGVKFAAMVWQDNIYGVQFHPEKSQEVGLKILKNFVEL